MLIGPIIALVLCVAIFAASRVLRKKPELAAKVMWWAPNAAMVYVRYASVFFMVMSGIGIVFYLILITVHLI
jgi:hypothetical protein